MHRIIVKFFLFSLVVASAISCKDDTPKDFSDVTTEKHAPDSVFAIYEDSMKKYFGPLEQDLIRRYRINHKDLATQEEFYNFYRNTYTLRNNLKKTLQSHIKELQERGVMAENMPDFSWFKQVAKGLEVADVNHHSTADIFYDYEIMLAYAQKTEGIADDEYTKLIRVSFDDDHYYPVWVKTYEDDGDIGCSLLGKGKHYIVIEQILQAQKAGDLFKKEIAKIKQLVFRDIFFRKEYCLDAEEAISELELIIKKLPIKEGEKKLFNARITQFKDPEKYKIQFKCEEGNCLHDESVRPDV